MNLFIHSFGTVFPLEYTHKKRPPSNGWITQVIKKSSKKLRLLNILNKQFNKHNYISYETTKYISNSNRQYVPRHIPA
jgi:hypothetical protein